MQVELIRFFRALVPVFRDLPGSGRLKTDFQIYSIPDPVLLLDSLFKKKKR
jgi:hypothetical protein